MTRTDEIWKTEALGKIFLEDVRSGIPLYQEHLDVLLRVIHAWNPGVRTFLDLGGGDGILGRAIALRFPDARGIVLDFSESMIEQAKKKNSDLKGRVEFVLDDFSSPAWTGSILTKSRFDVVVSGFSIHHQSDERKRALYREIFDILKPGGLFLNMEHVSSASKRIESCFEEIFVDSLYRDQQRKGVWKTWDQVADEFYRRPDKEANRLAPVEEQCEWLRAIGFEDVDCYFKLFELALFGGRKPALSDRL